MTRVVVALAALVLALASVNAQGITFAPNTAAEHRTARYRDPQTGAPQTRVVILRRHQPFTVTIKGANSKTKYSVELAGPGAGRQAGQSAKLKVVKGATATNGGVVTLMHTQGAIGAFNLIAANGATRLASVPVWFIANPYAEKDETFVPPTFKADELYPPELAEHLENEKGALWQGSSRSNSWIPWAYNQFDMNIIETVLEQLDGMSVKQRASTALVARYLTSQSGNVLHGRWDGQYSDGKQPGFWASTTQIIAQHRTTKSAVKYGQCWVFAGLLTSFCRSIGIPARPLTNFDSAHERKPFDQQCITKYKKTASGYEKEDADNSVWNFHVWCDVWMRRPDIKPAGRADGWQAVDATPQEESSGPNEAPFADEQYRCGPAPLALIKNMEVKGNYDVAFVAGEANCVKIDYVDGKEWSRRTDVIGEMVYTKSPDSKCRGSQTASGYTSVCPTNLARSYSKVGSFLQVEELMRKSLFTVQYPEKGVRLGKPFKLRIGAGSFKGEADYSIVLSAVSYNSKHSFGVLARAESVAKDPATANSAEIVVSNKDWGQKWLKDAVPAKTLTLDVVFAVSPKGASAKQKPFLQHVMIPVLPPKLAMLCGNKNRAAKKNQVIACNVQFHNPLPYALTNAVMSFAISGQSSKSEQDSLQQALQSPLQIPQSAKAAAAPFSTDVAAAEQETDATDVDPNSRSTFKGRFMLNGAVGTQYIIAKLSSKELDGVSGVMDITIQP